LSFQKIEELGFTRLAQPPYSPDLAPWDFFLFGDLKKEFHRKLHVPKCSRLCGDSDFDQITIQTLWRAFDEWIERLHRCNANKGEYI
jgi:coproporphyrinogen III oxidase-like Fe-S oxidoreductase